MRPIVHGLEEKYSGRIRFLYLDVRDARNSAAKTAFGYVATPHFVLLAPDARVLRQHTGPMAPAELEGWLESVLQ